MGRKAPPFDSPDHPRSNQSRAGHLLMADDPAKSAEANLPELCLQTQHVVGPTARATARFSAGRETTPGLIEVALRRD